MTPQFHDLVLDSYLNVERFSEFMDLYQQMRDVCDIFEDLRRLVDSQEGLFCHEEITVIPHNPPPLPPTKSKCTLS